MSGPLIPHIELPEIPIPAWSVAALLVVVALTFLYSIRKPESRDSTSLLFALIALAAPVIFWLVLRPAYFEPNPENVRAFEAPTIKPFGTLVAFGVYIGSVVAVRHGRDRGLDIDKMNSFIFWVVGLGFVGGHMLDAIFYTREKLVADPLYIFKLWGGLSSFGGFIGAMIGALAYKYFKRDNVLSYVDTVCSAFPLAWVFGRSGCASVHDHPGKISDAWFAVKCVDYSHLGHGESSAFLCQNTHDLGRYDLGLIECVLTIPLAVTFAILWARKPRHIGFFAGWMCILYAPVRFVLDFFRATTADKIGEVDPRHFGLTPAQWASFGLVAIGFYVLYLGRKYYPNPPSTYAAVQALAAEPADGQLEEDDEEEERAREAAPAPKKKKLADVSPSTKKKNKKKAARPPLGGAADEASKEAEFDTSKPVSENEGAGSNEASAKAVSPKEKLAVAEREGNDADSDASE